MSKTGYASIGHRNDTPVFLPLAHAIPREARKAGLIVLRYAMACCAGASPIVSDRPIASRPRWARLERAKSETAMATIGSFKPSGDEFLGEIITLQVQAKNVRIVPEAVRTTGSAPSHRVYVGRAEIGAAWTKTSDDGHLYLTVKLDDPSFSAPIFATLNPDQDGGGHTLTWVRTSPRN